jgi:hypothetical protein
MDAYASVENMENGYCPVDLLAVERFVFFVLR